MTPEEYRTAIEASENRINEQLEQDKRSLLCSLQSKNRTYIKNPGLVGFTQAYADLENAARARMAEEAEVIETRFYEELEG